MTETGDIGGSCELKNEENISSEGLQINKLLFEQAGQDPNKRALLKELLVKSREARKGLKR